MTTRTLEIELPTAVAEELAALVEEGWFTGEAEIVRLALAEYLRRRPVGLGALDHRILEALVRLATGAEGQEEADSLLRRYLEEEISLSKMANVLGVSRFELQESFERLGVPLRLGPATLEEARDEVKVARNLK